MVNTVMPDSGIYGKRVFFLYPPPVLNDIVDELARREFEVYLVNDHKRLQQALKQFPESIVFINLDSGLPEPQWAEYVKELKLDPQTSSVGTGVICMNDDAILRKKYLMELQIPCGFVILKLGAARAADILTKTLEANEARGRRRFVRAICMPGIAKCMVDFSGRVLQGELSDISSAGIAARFDNDKNLPVGTVFHNMQITVRGVRVVSDCFVAAKRADPQGSTYVIMFNPATLDFEKKDKLRTLVCKINQSAMDSLLENLALTDEASKDDITDLNNIASSDLTDITF